ncbi:MAG: MurR/RpiR family transcriptional regulator [Clostridia bacterium]|nr:MurR/RpiR family transcriptional regulator [Clostridia bacterium]
MKKTELTEKIEEKYKKMSKGHKRIADYITQNYDKAAFMTANKLGNKVGVSESTVVRFADSLGYDGYPHLQRAIQDVIRNKLTTVQLIEMTGELSDQEVLSKVLKSDMENIRNTLAEIDPQVFDEVVSSILKADKVYIMGMRSAAPLAQFMGYYMDFMMRNVCTVNSGISDVFEQLIHISDKDVFIGISFPRYSNRTIDGMRFASSRGAKCIAITDGTASPLCQLSDVALCAKSNMTSFVDSLVAPVSVVNALIVAIGLKRKDEMRLSFGELEKIWIEHNVYAGGK